VVKRFRTRIVEIEAVRFTGDNWDELYDWTQGSFRTAKEVLETHEGLPLTGEVFDKLHNAWIGVAPGQWIVRGVKGEYYPCDDETFHWKYEEVL
jgi:hypothetical protein